MKIYDETTGAEIVVPDETKGYLYEGHRVVKHIEDAYEVMDGTVTEDCQFYHAYTAEELAEREKPTLQEQVDANAAAILELAQMLAGGE